MKKTINYRYNFPLIFISILISFIPVGCSEPKYTQCEQIIQIANGVARKTKQLTNNQTEQTIEMKSWLQAADLMIKAAQQLEALPLNDPKLLKYQTTLAKIYRTNSEATYAIIKAWENKDIDAAKIAQADVQIVGILEKQLATGINAYCLDNRR
jgi:hypothetical protein